MAELDPAIHQRLADVLETRGADAQQQSMREAFLGRYVGRRNAAISAHEPRERTNVEEPLHTVLFEE